jgi:peptide/nickel transport system ATP-binding protein
MTLPPLLKVQDLTLSVRDSKNILKILTGVNLTVNHGEIHGLVGESGSGKSITARSLLSSFPKNSIVSGHIFFEDEDVLQMSKKELEKYRRTSAAMIFQDPWSSVDPLWKIEDYICAVLRQMGEGKSESYQKAKELLFQVEIKDPELVLKQYPWQLSGGMLQRVVIAGALAGEPRLLIADEATTALDVTIQAEIVKLLRTLVKTKKLSILFLTHDLALASENCDRVSVMYAGRIVESQNGSGIFTNPRHPYTKGLLKSRPSIDERFEGGLFVLPGSPTNADSAPAGCAFNPRCLYRDDSLGCNTRVPPNLTQQDISVACFRSSEPLN